MKRLKFMLLSIKNNLRHMPLVYAMLCVIFTTCFVFQGMVVRIFSVSHEKERIIFVGASAVIALLCALLMIKVFILYFKVGTQRRTVYAMMGAKFGDTAASVVIESLLVYVAAIVAGVIIDSIIASFVSITEKGFLDGELFGMAAGWTLLLPTIGIAISLLIERVKLKRALKIK